MRRDAQFRMGTPTLARSRSAFVSVRRAGDMSDVNFTNSYSTKIYVAYMRLDEGCRADSGDPWVVLGWINLEPGQSQSRPNPTGNQYYYYYAEADDGAYWAGPYGTEVSSERFDKCEGIGVSVSDGPNPWHGVGMRELDLAAWGGVNFT
jgi:uncharacterized membrane protein